ncbi:hypothetical protein HDU91_003645, partial [Kappamyces sp. JEL0680]
TESLYSPIHVDFVASNGHDSLSILCASAISGGWEPCLQQIRLRSGTARDSSVIEPSYILDTNRAVMGRCLDGTHDSAQMRPNEIWNPFSFSWEYIVHSHARPSCFVRHDPFIFCATKDSCIQAYALMSKSNCFCPPLTKLVYIGKLVSYHSSTLCMRIIGGYLVCANSSSIEIWDLSGILQHKTWTLPSQPHRTISLERYAVDLTPRWIDATPLGIYVLLQGQAGTLLVSVSFLKT